MNDTTDDGSRGLPLDPPVPAVTVDWRASLAFVGTVVKFLSVPLLVPLGVALVYGERDAVSFVVAIAVALVVGLALERLDPDPDVGVREGFLMVAGSWLAVGVVGTVPYLVAAHGLPGFPATTPASTLADPVNALFESMSGFTTTGSTVLGEISLERHGHAMLLWRQLTQWLGGMGIVVLALAILPRLSVGGAQLMEQEAPGIGVEKLTPRIAETARVLWGLYLGFTALEVALLYGSHLAGLAPEMTLYQAVAHGFTTMPTGGFSPMADSIGAFSAVAQWIVIPFMAAAGVNFGLFWWLVRGQPRRLLENQEFRWYGGAAGVVTALVAGVLFAGGGAAARVGGVAAGSVEPALRHAVFQAFAIVNTTGYATSDFAAWSGAGQAVLVVAMFLGGSGASTGGGVKIVRWLVVVKALRRELFTSVHASDVRPVRIAGRAVDEGAVRGVFAFTLLYLAIFGVGTALVALDGARAGVDLSVVEAMTGVAATLGNIGPALGDLGPFGSYLGLPDTTKLLMVLFMWAGRLEIITVLVVLTPSYWRS